jgi:hypothetical protein
MLGTVALLYQADSGFCGIDSFTYQICNANGDCGIASVYIDVTCLGPNQPPVANNDSITICGVDAVIWVLDNDYEPDGQSMFFESNVITNTPNGSAFPTVVGAISYTADTGFTGLDSFQYGICDPLGACSQAMVYINVLPAGQCVWPGDTDNDGIVNNLDLLPIGLAYGETGPLRDNASILWEGQQANDWVTSLTPGINDKHIDSDGNGIVGDSDTMAILLNYGSTYLKGMSIGGGGTSPQLAPYFSADTIFVGSDVILPVKLGSATLQANDVYGLAFTLYYDPSMVIAGSLEVSFNSSWIGTEGADLIGLHKDFHNAGFVDIALTRTDHTSISGDGTIGHISFVMEENLAGKTDIVQDLIICSSNAKMINEWGQELDVEATCDTVVVYDATTGIPNPNSDAIMNLYPNPAAGIVNIEWENFEINRLQISNLQGQIVYENELQDEANVLSIEVGNLPNGTYIIKAKNQNTVVTRKLVIEK